jgi:hypothetical protein
MSLMAIFISWPWLALVPAAYFALLYRVSTRRLAAITATAWLLYAGYEYAMLRRWMCSGECNIRVDLLLLYPLLFLASIAASASALWSVVHRRSS